MIGSIVKVLVCVIVFLVNSWLFAEERAGERVWRIDDFEDGDLKAPAGPWWFPLSDDIAGGDSIARLEISGGVRGASKHALKLAGRRSGGKVSFVGAWVALERTGRAVDLGPFDRIRLRVRGGGRVFVGFRDMGVNHMASIDLTPEWRAVEVPFGRLEPQGKVPVGTRLDPAALRNFGVTTPYVLRDGESTATDVLLEIDEVEVVGPGEGSAPPAASGPPGTMGIFAFAPLSAVPRAGWVELATDPSGDSSAGRLPDVTRLEVVPLAGDGRVWFRTTLRERPHDRWIGVNVALDVDGDPKNGQPWWGANKEFRFDRLVTVYCIRVPGGCQGYVGVADAAQAAAFVPGGSGESLRFAIDRERSAFVVGVPREVLRLGPGSARMLAAVGSALLFGDDVPGQGAVELP